MWRPVEVVEQHRSRARSVWALLLVMILAYAFYDIFTTMKQREDPAISLQLKTERYDFPTITVCSMPGNGCNSYSYSCASTFQAYVFRANGFNTTQVKGLNLATPNEAFPRECADIRVHDIPASEKDIGIFPVSVHIELLWETNPRGEGDDDAILETDTAKNTVESVYMFLTDPYVPRPLERDNSSTFIGDLPFDIIPVGQLGTDITYCTLTMGMIENMNLKGTSERTYLAGSKTVKKFRAHDGWFSEPADHNTGVMLLDVYQPPLSHTFNKACDPFSWMTWIGNVGGTWELLLLLWGLLFIATDHNEPKFKSRNLKKSARKGVTVVHSTASGVLTAARKKPISARQLERNDSGQEQTPEWDNFSTNNQNMSGSAAALGTDPRGSGRWQTLQCKRSVDDSRGAQVTPPVSS